MPSDDKLNKTNESRRAKKDYLRWYRKEEMDEGMERIHSGIYNGVFERMKERGSIGEWFIKIPLREMPVGYKEFEIDMKLLGYGERIYNDIEVEIIIPYNRI